MRTRRAATWGTVLVAVTCCAAAAAHTSDSPPGNSFDGTCSFAGTARFAKPLSNQPIDNAYEFSGPGTCSGKLNGRPVSNEPVTVLVAGPFTGTCLETRSTGPAPGTTTFTRGTRATADDVPIRFSVEFTGTGSELDLSIDGTYSGHGSGHATFATTRTPPDVPLRCAGEGNRELPFDARNETDGAVSSPRESRFAHRVVVPPQALGAVLGRGLRARCLAPPAAPCRLRARLSRSRARRLGLESTQVGQDRRLVPPNRDRVALLVPVPARVRERLRGAHHVTLFLTGDAGGRRLDRRLELYAG
jgi:hypothetical protein